jgi:hypothetical protein
VTGRDGRDATVGQVVGRQHAVPVHAHASASLRVLKNSSATIRWSGAAWSSA